MPGAVGLLILAAAGCGGGAAMKGAPAPPCETRVPAIHPSDTVTVVLFDKVDLAHAPWGRNREEQFIFDQLYETLVKIDCRGAIQPGLASSWKRASDGWLLELRDDAHFWDESPVTARDVVTSFEPALRAHIAIPSIDVVDEGHVLVHGVRGAPDIKLLALPMLAVTKPNEFGAPIGTGPWQIDNDTPVAEAVVIRPVLEPGPMVRFVQGEPGDEMDVMSGNADAIITDHGEVIDYARSRPHTAIAPLPWERAYILVSGSRSRQLREGTQADDLPASVCDALAKDAVNVDARGGSAFLNVSQAAFPIGMKCESIHAADAPPGSLPELSHRLVYVNGDVTARSLAERIVALAAMDTASAPQARALARAVPNVTSGLRAVGVSAAEMSMALRKEEEFGYVLSFSWDADLPSVVGRFDACCWLFSTSGRLQTEKMIPLVETRAHFIATSDRIGFAADPQGHVRLMIPTRETGR
jgi:hypothetical protein